MHKILAISALILILVSCKSEGNEKLTQDSIWMSLELYFNDNTDITQASATFRYNGSSGAKIQLNDQADILFNGASLIWQSASANYLLELQGFLQSGEFEYTDFDGNVFNNEVTINPIQFPVDFDSIPRPGDFDLYWSGETLGDFETVIVRIDGEIDGELQTFLANGIGDESIEFGEGQLSLFTEGIAEVTMDRSYNPPLQQSHATGGSINGRYRAENVLVHIE